MSCGMHDNHEGPMEPAAKGEGVARVVEYKVHEEVLVADVLIHIQTKPMTQYEHQHSRNMRDAINAALAPFLSQAREEGVKIGLEAAAEAMDEICAHDIPSKTIRRLSPADILKDLEGK